MSWFNTGIKMSVFVVLFTGTLLYMPTEIVTGADPIQYQIPLSFDPWLLMSNTTGIEHVISQGSRVGYSFSDTTAKHYVDIVWDTWFGVEQIRARKHVQVGIFPDWYEPTLELDDIQGVFNSEYNNSIIKVSNKQGTIALKFEDTNSTRNNITAAWVDNSMNCTVYYSTESYENDIWQSKELVLSILTFKLPSLISSVNPFLGFTLSAFIYIPIVYVILSISIKVLRG